MDYSSAVCESDSSVIMSLTAIIVFFTVLLACSSSTIALGSSWKQPENTHQLQTAAGSCPPWMRKMSNCSAESKSCCECGSSLNGLIKCNRTTREVKLLACYCISYSKLLNETIVGNCPYSCSSRYMEDIPTQVAQLDKFTCSDYMRTGQLCGNCIHANYSPPVYSYSIACVKCKNYRGKWALYVAAVFIPLTVFYFIVIAFRISVVSPKLQCYILISQVVATPSHVRYVYSLQKRYTQYHQVQSKLAEVGISMFSLWNLDFFRSIYHPFCLNPEISSLGILALDYIIAVYPLLLVIITYCFLELYSRHAAMQMLLRPFYKCCFYFRKEWNIKQSLISVFATFLLLSYVKVLNTSFDLLLPTITYDISGTKTNYSFLYHNGSIKLFSSEHTPYAVLAIIMMLLFNIVPLILLYLYPCICFQKLLNRCRGFNCQTLHIFMDTFLSNFRTTPVDCRYFAAIYLTLRIVNLLVYSITLSRFYYPIISLFLLMAALLVIIFQPYKDSVYNRLDAFFFIAITVSCVGATAYALTPGDTPFNDIFLWLVISSCAIPVLYITILLVNWATPYRIRTKIEKCYKLVFPVFWRAEQRSTLEDEIIEATDYPRYQSLSETIDSANTASPKSNISHQTHSYGTAY